jgi:hypothetical protein
LRRGREGDEERSASNDEEKARHSYMQEERDEVPQRLKIRGRRRMRMRRNVQ